MSFKKFCKESEESSWKKLIGILWDGTKVFEVDGEYVRDNLEHTEFWGGAHHYEDDYVPENEIWVEKMKEERKDNPPIGVHEIFEWFQMKYLGTDYDHAHDKANSVEKIIRAFLNIKRD